MKMRNDALILIDVQAGFHDPKWGRRNNPQAETNIARLLAAFRAANAHVIHVQHRSAHPQSPLRPGQAGVEFMPEAVPRPHEPVFAKSVHSAFIGTKLEEYLRTRGICHVVIAGIAVDHCVSTTTRMACDLGFDVTLVSDATIAFDRAPYAAELIHATSLASLREEFAQIMDTREVCEALSVQRPAQSTP